MGDELRFEGRTAIVTGGGSGIGRAHAALLAARGANVVVNDVGWSGFTHDRTDGQDRAETAAREIRDAGGSAVGHPGDVTSDEDARSMVELALDTFGGLDILVANAGISERARAPVQDLPNEELRTLLEVHLLGTLRVTRAAWPVFERARHGRILTTGSASAFGCFEDLPRALGIDHLTGGGYAGAYVAAKSSLFAVTRQLAGAGRAHGINVNMLMPWASTPLSSETTSASPFGQWVVANLNVDRTVAGALWFLHDTCDVTGQFISSAGGRVSRVFLAQADGYFDRDLRPEDVRDHWQAIRGDVDDDERVHDAIELSGVPSEARALFERFGPPAAHGARLEGGGNAEG